MSFPTRYIALQSHTSNETSKDDLPELPILHHRPHIPKPVPVRVRIPRHSRVVLENPHSSVNERINFPLVGTRREPSRVVNTGKLAENRTLSLSKFIPDDSAHTSVIHIGFP